jgi:hypothetical protein
MDVRLMGVHLTSIHLTGVHHMSVSHTRGLTLVGRFCGFHFPENFDLLPYCSAKIPLLWVASTPLRS